MGRTVRARQLRTPQQNALQLGPVLEPFVPAEAGTQNLAKELAPAVWRLAPRAASFDPDIGVANDFAPPSDLCLDHSAKLLGRACNRIEGQRRQARSHLRE